MWTYGKPRPRLVDAGHGARGPALLALALAVALAAALAGAGLAAAMAPRAATSLPHCYWINPPLAHLDRALMGRGLLDCSLAECQLTLRRTADAGWACFFPRPWG